MKNKLAALPGQNGRCINEIKNEAVPQDGLVACSKRPVSPSSNPRTGRANPSANCVHARVNQIRSIELFGLLQIGNI